MISFLGFTTRPSANHFIAFLFRFYYTQPKHFTQINKSLCSRMSLDMFQELANILTTDLNHRRLKRVVLHSGPRLFSGILKDKAKGAVIIVSMDKLV